MKKAFTMIELVFVIVVIGILASIAIPRFALTRNDAMIAKGQSVVGAIKSSLASERQLRAIRGDFNPITSLSVNKPAGAAFGSFTPDANANTTPVLDTTIPACNGAERGCWVDSGGGTYTYRVPGGAVDVVFTVAGGNFTCDTNIQECLDLTQ
jgi:general secretion pathway protein G